MQPFHQRNPAYASTGRPQVAPAPVQQVPGSAAKSDKPPGCVKKTSLAYKTWSLGGCGASIIAGVKIVLAIITITSVWRAFAALDDRVSDLVTVVESWQATPLSDVSVQLGAADCPTGWTKLTGTTWPGASTPSCACPFGARNPEDNTALISSESEFCDGNQTQGGCASLPNLPAVELNEWLGQFGLCGLFSGPPSLDANAVDRPRPEGGSCPTGFKVCGGGHGSTATPNWDVNRALCFPNALACPVRSLQASTEVNALLLSAGVGDTLTLMDYTSGDTLEVEMAGGNGTTAMFNTTGPAGSSLLASLGGVGATASVTDLSGMDAALLVSRAATLAPMVRHKVVLNNKVCFGANQGDSVGYEGPGRAGFNDYDSQCLTLDERWVSVLEVGEIDLLDREFNDTTICRDTPLSNGMTVACADCSANPTCERLACVSQCDRLDTYTQNTLVDVNPDEDFDGNFDLLHRWTVMARRETFWREDCTRPRSQLVEVLDPLQEVRDQQESVASTVTVLSSITIGTSLLIFLTLCGCKCMKCFGKTPITQRVVIIFYSTLIGTVVSSLKVVLVVLITLVIADIRAFFAIFAINAGDACSDESVTNETMANLGRSLADAYDSNLLAIVMDSLLLLSSLYTIYAEATDGEPLCEKGKPK